MLIGTCGCPDAAAGGDDDVVASSNRGDTGVVTGVRTASMGWKHSSTCIPALARATASTRAQWGSDSGLHCMLEPEMFRRWPCWSGSEYKPEV